MSRINADTVEVLGGNGPTINGVSSLRFALGGGSVKLDFDQGGNDTVRFFGMNGVSLELSKVKGRFGVGNDSVSFSLANTAQHVALKMGDGNNTLTSSGSSLRGKVAIQTGLDNDVVLLSGGGLRTLRKTSIATGKGFDIVEVNGFGTAGLIEQLTVKLNDGPDEFRGSSNRFIGQAKLDGGDGDDTSSGADNTFAAGSPTVKSVETSGGQW